MKVLVLGSGAREHAIAWKLNNQKECSEIFAWPGNDGVFNKIIKPLPSAHDLDSCLASALQQKIEIAVIGPETFLAQGYADAFRTKGILTVGPNQEAARLETSKLFAKAFFQKAQIPTSPYHIFEDEASLLQFKRTLWPWVLKLDGLASGKGVVIAQSDQDVKDFARKVWSTQLFGKGPHRILTEDFIPGREISYIGFCDGRHFVSLESATDHKALNDGNQGPNTGGMGAVSPSPLITPSLELSIHKQIIEPFLRELTNQSIDFKGILFFGLMITPDNQPILLECNTRLGDPETQCVLPRLKSSLLSLLLDTAKGSLGSSPPLSWDPRHSVYVVASADGYPEKPQTGDLISGLDYFKEPPSDTFTDTFIFFGGVKKTEGHWQTHGGRVLGVGALGDHLLIAQQKAYQALKQVHWNKLHYRKDIGST